MFINNINKATPLKVNNIIPNGVVFKLITSLKAPTIMLNIKTGTNEIDNENKILIVVSFFFNFKNSSSVSLSNLCSSKRKKF